MTFSVKSSISTNFLGSIFKTSQVKTKKFNYEAIKLNALMKTKSLSIRCRKITYVL